MAAPTNQTAPQTGAQKVIADAVDPARRPDVLLRVRKHEGYEVNAWWLVCLRRYLGRRGQPAELGPRRRLSRIGRGAEPRSVVPLLHSHPHLAEVGEGQSLGGALDVRAARRSSER